MYIHIGNRIIVSDKRMIGVFNVVSLKKSELNNKYLKSLNDGMKTIVIGTDNTIIQSNVSPFTIIKRNILDGSFIWRRENDDRL